MNLIELISPQLKFVGLTIDNPHRAVITDGITVILGPNGAGKTSLAKILEGGWNFMTNELATALDHRPRVRSIEFSDIHALTGFKATYYQQRYESGMNDEAPLVRELFADRIGTPQWCRMSAALGLDHVVDKRANCLSSGELRKMLIANMLFDLPEVLILDNPYIGLDASSRTVLNETISQISARGIAVILLLCNPNEIPDSAQWVIPMDGMSIGRAVEAPYAPGQFDGMFEYEVDLAQMPEYDNANESSPIVFEMKDCNVRFGDRVILQHVDWTVKKGECWALSGPNGSGKSTLLSLINADNPQAYSNDLTVFGHRRGSGESIWDIKKRIGYISPEMHLYFRGYNNTLLDVVAAGLNDTVGFYQRITADMRAVAHRWLKLLGMEALSERSFSTLSYGQQRLGLLARTFIKNPELLILDEPLHGLDMARKRAVGAIVDQIIANKRSSLIYVTHYEHEIPTSVTHHKRLGQNA